MDIQSASHNFLRLTYIRPPVKMVDIVARITPTEMFIGAKVVGFMKLDFPSGGTAAGKAHRGFGVEVMA